MSSLQPAERSFRRALVSFASLVLSCALLATGSLALRVQSASAAVTGTNNVVGAAAAWIKAHQQPDGGFEVAGFPGFETPDAVLALAEASQTTPSWSYSQAISAVQNLRYGGSGPTPLDYLDDLAEQAVSDGARGTAAKLIVLDAVPLGIDPADFDPSGDSALPVDLSATLDPGGCSADTASFGFFNQTLFGILAKYLVCDGSVPPSALTTVRDAQQSNGGWNFRGDPNGTDVDIDTTSMAIQALVAGGVDSSDPAVSKALGLLARSINPDGSWPSPFSSSDPNSTALGILGVSAAGFDVTSSCWRDEFYHEGAGAPYTSPISWLISQQDVDGHIRSPNDSFGVNTFATSQSVQALRRGWLPVARASTTCTNPTYFAEGATDGGFETWILLTNPDPSEDATARLTFLTETGARSGPFVVVPPLSRRSVKVNDWVTTFDVATVVESISLPVYAERALYSTRAGKVGAHLGKEIKRPAHSWFLAEGATAGGFETWILIANPSPSMDADVSVTFMTTGGEVPGPSFRLPAGTRRSVRANDWVPSDFNVATKVTSTGAEVVAERSMYMGQGSRFVGATGAPGTAMSRASWFLAEGATAGGFETWILIANPSPSMDADVSVTFMTTGGEVPGPSFRLPAGTRRSVRANDWVPSDFNVATKVTSTGAEVVAERALYSDHPVLGKTASSGEGVGWTSTSWFLAEGATAGGFETWILIANPSPSMDADVSVTFMTTGGEVPGPSFRLPAGTRRSVRANDWVPSDFNVATKVTSTGAEVVAEHTVYSPPYLSGDATGGPGIAG